MSPPLKGYYSNPEFVLNKESIISFEAVDVFSENDSVYLSIGDPLGLPSSLSSLTINYCNFESSVKANHLNITDVFELKESSIKNISLFKTTLPHYSNVNVKWEELRNKLQLNNPEHSIGGANNNYKGESQDELSDVYSYDDLMSVYNMFFSIYKDRGDLASANGCFIEMKDLETRRLKYLYETKGGSTNYLNYQLNKFLRFFALYGTSPVRSVQISGWIILIFGGFYFFFHSNWDNINRKYLIVRAEKLIGYFTSNNKLEDFYSETHKQDIITYEGFKEQLKGNKSRVPFFFMLFLKPLYWLSILKYKWNIWIYRRIEFLKGSWSDLSKSKKVSFGFFTFLFILLYGSYLILIRSMNSLILSVNTFTTLGFGDIPVTGISRYVAIIEGFLGWFLLSIFSVSLISQILQN